MVSFERGLGRFSAAGLAMDMAVPHRRRLGRSYRSRPTLGCAYARPDETRRRNTRQGLALVGDTLLRTRCSDVGRVYAPVAPRFKGYMAGDLAMAVAELHSGTSHWSFGDGDPMVLDRTWRRLGAGRSGSDGTRDSP